jgi:hypothetical protein
MEDVQAIKKELVKKDKATVDLASL